MSDAEFKAQFIRQRLEVLFENERRGLFRHRESELRLPEDNGIDPNHSSRRFQPATTPNNATPAANQNVV